jgi:hypothetical protein
MKEINVCMFGKVKEIFEVDVSAADSYILLFIDAVPCLRGRGSRTAQP